MNSLFPLFVALFGAAVGLLGSGSVHLWPEVALRAPKLNAVFLFPVAAFGLFAVAFALRPARLHMPTLGGIAGVLAISLCYLLLPRLTASQSTDGQSGMLEALVSMATLPLTLAAFLLAALVQVIAKNVRRDEA